MNDIIMQNSRLQIFPQRISLTGSCKKEGFLDLQSRKKTFKNCSVENISKFCSKILNLKTVYSNSCSTVYIRLKYKVSFPLLKYAQDLN